MTDSEFPALEPSRARGVRHEEDLAFTDRLLNFTPAAAALYERDHGPERVIHLQRCMVAGLLIYAAFGFENLFLMRDFHGVTALVRDLVICPLGIFLTYLLGKVRALWREVLACVIAVTGISYTILIVWLSHDPLRFYGMTDTLLVLIFFSVIAPLTVPASLVFVGTTVLAILTSVHTHPPLAPELTWVFSFQVVTAAGYAIYSNYRIEYARRASYLANLREVFNSDQLQAASRRLNALSMTDAMTGLPNRRALDDALQGWAAAAPPRRAAVGFLMIDVDHFKLFNDRYGHPAGDACLRRVAAVLSHVAQEAQGLAARYGGEEFALLVKDAADEAGVLALANRICTEVEAMRLPHLGRRDGPTHVTVSIGATFAPAGDAANGERLVCVADAALYAAKRGGRNAAVSRPIHWDVEPYAASA